MLRLVRSAAAATLLLLAAVVAHAQPPTREDCAAAHPAAWGRAGKDVPWVPTFDAVTLTMLTMAQVTPEDRVLDLGAGDGRIAITAAKPPFGARAEGIEYDPELAKLAACLVQAEGVADKVRIVEGDIFKEDFGDASVVTMFLLPQVNLCVRNRVLALPPGTRVVSHQYRMADWTPDDPSRSRGATSTCGSCRRESTASGISGTARARRSRSTCARPSARSPATSCRSGLREPLASATLHGLELRFAFDVAGVAVELLGHRPWQRDHRRARRRAAARTTVGRLRGALRPAPWAEMAPGCRRYYGR